MSSGAGQPGAGEGERAYRQARFELPAEGTEIVLVRHGESMPARLSTPFDRLDGQSDPDLAPEGVEQAEAVGARLAGEGPFAAIYVSPLRRTHQTAAPLAARLGMVPRVEPDLREVLLGEWEGAAFRRNLAEGHPTALAMLEEERWDVIPGAESNEAFAARLRAAVDRIAAAHRGERVVAVSHGGSIGMILAEATGSRPFAFVGADNASISRLVVTPSRWLVRGFNDTGHLRGH